VSRWIVRETGAAQRGWGAWAALAVVPWLLLVFLVARYGLDAPLIDQWSFVSQLESQSTGTLTFDSLRSQHGEHRPFFPRLIMLGLAGVSGWNVRYEIAMNVLLATALFFALARLFRREISSPVGTPPVWLWALLSLLVFSLSQWENWLWGWQLQVFLNVLSVVFGIVLLTRRPFEWTHFAGAAIAGIVATYSFGNGLLFWPVGLGVLALAASKGPPKRLLLGAWAVLSTVVVASYMAGFHRGGSAASFQTVVTQPVGHLRYVLTFLGSPLASFSGSAFPPRDTGIAALVGGLGLLLLTLAARRAIRRRPNEIDRVIPFFALAGYALFSSLIAAVSRLRFGIPQALASRYTTISSLFWIGLIGMTLLATAPRAPAEPGVAEKADRGGRWSLAAVAALVAASSLVSIHIFPERHILLLPARSEMVRGESVELLKRLHPEVHQVTHGLVALRRLRLSVFRDAKTAEAAALAGPRRLGRFGQILRPLFRPESARVGRAIVIPVEVTNPTTEVWSAAGVGPGTLSVRLSYHWFDYAGRTAVYDGDRTLLPHDVRPGETVSVNARVSPPPLPGHYLLRLTMVQEGVEWFDNVSAGSADLSVDVVLEDVR
jgi:hypothetical protein